MSRLKIFYLLLLIFYKGVNSQKLSNFISCEGYAKVNVKPTEGILTINISKYDTSQNDAIENLNSEKNKIRFILREFGISDSLIKISDYSLSNELNCETHFLKYIATFELNVKVSYNYKVLTGILLKLKEKNIGQLGFNFKGKITEELEEKIRVELLKKAVDNAQKKANFIAGNQKLCLGLPNIIATNKSPINISTISKEGPIYYLPPSNTFLLAIKKF